MPGKDGLETVMALRRLELSVRIVAMSGGGTLWVMDCLPMAKELGARRTLQKPFEREELLNAVDAALTAD